MVNWQYIIKNGTLVFFLGMMIQTAVSCNQQAAAAEKVASGEELYISYCQICHGEKGDGAMADQLKVQPADLTRISARRNGEFPEKEIFDIIDGRGVVRGHGTREMPIWGMTFRESEHLDNEKQVSKKIQLLVDYLKSIQEEN